MLQKACSMWFRSSNIQFMRRDRICHGHEDSFESLYYLEASHSARNNNNYLLDFTLSHNIKKSNIQNHRVGTSNRPNPLKYHDQKGQPPRWKILFIYSNFVITFNLTKGDICRYLEFWNSELATAVLSNEKAKSFRSRR